MSELAMRGRASLLAILFSFVAISVVTGTDQIFSGLKPAIVPIVRIILAFVLAYFVYAGNTLARVLFAVFAGGGALICLYWLASLLMQPAPNVLGSALLAVVTLFYAYASVAMIASKSIHEFWAARQSQ